MSLHAGTALVRLSFSFCGCHMVNLVCNVLMQVHVFYVAGHVTQTPKHLCQCSVCLRKQVLYPALQPLLQDASWARWDATLSRMAYSTEAMGAFLGSHEAWQTRVDAKRALRAEERKSADTAAVAEPVLRAEERKSATAAAVAEPVLRAEERKSANAAAAAKPVAGPDEGGDIERARNVSQGKCVHKRVSRQARTDEDRVLS